MIASLSADLALVAAVLALSASLLISALAARPARAPTGRAFPRS